MNATAHLLHLHSYKKARTAQKPAHRARHPSDRTREPAAEAVPCPVCGHRAGFILDEDGFGYRVLEDDRDTDLLEDHADATPLACAHCDTTITLVEALALAHEVRWPRAPRVEPHHTLPGHPHDGGSARWRTSRDGTLLPACPQCPRDHGFLADLDGVAYHVLEDDEDTELLSDVDDLLCPDCGAVFTTGPPTPRPARTPAKAGPHGGHRAPKDTNPIRLKETAG